MSGGQALDFRSLNSVGSAAISVVNYSSRPAWISFQASSNSGKPPMTKDLARFNELKPMALCEPCQGIQRNWRKAPGHAELVQRSNRKEERDTGIVTITRYVCDRCGTGWEYENDKTNQQAGWSVVGR